MALGSIGKYERLDVLGHGASGIVYLARDTLLRRQVAIKEVSAQGEERDRFLEEARVLDRLRHPNIVSVHGVDTIAGKLVIDMEYVDGENLLEILRHADGPLPILQAVDIATQVCEGLAYAQTRHIVHRDIKPANILVSRLGQVKLVDFGLAQVLGTNSFVGGAGTYAYMAPEDFGEHEASDASADIWAVGVVLYEMLTARRPFAVARAKDPFAWKRAIETDLIEPPDTSRPEIPAELSAICLTALERDRSLRYHSAAEMASALRRLEAVEVGTQTTYPMIANEDEDATSPLLLGASDVDGFLSVAPDNWEQARTALVTGSLSRWLWSIDEPPLAEIAQASSDEAARDDSDQDALLRDFLYRAGLDTVAAAHRAASSGASLLRAGSAEDAVKASMQAIRLDPAHPSYFLQLYKALVAAGDIAAATATIARGLEFHPKDRTMRREQALILSARPVVSATSVDFGAVRHGEQARTRISVKNASADGGVIQGRIASLPGWLEASPTSFITRHTQTITLTANTADLWEREQEYEGRIEIETSAGPLEVAVCVCVKPPLRLFQDVFLWYMPLLILALGPLFAGEVATMRHPYHHGQLPYYTIGMLASGLFFAALWQLCAQAGTGTRERYTAALGACLLPFGFWLLLRADHAPGIWPSFAVAAVPAAVLLIAQGIATLNAPKTWGRWPVWGWILGLAALVVTLGFWKQTEWMMRH